VFLNPPLSKESEANKRLLSRYFGLADRHIIMSREADNSGAIVASKDRVCKNDKVDMTVNLNDVKKGHVGLSKRKRSDREPSLMSYHIPKLSKTLDHGSTRESDGEMPGTSSLTSARARHSQYSDHDDQGDISDQDDWSDKDSTDDEESCNPPSAKCHKVDNISGMFDPFAVQRHKEMRLSHTQNSYISKYFTSYVKEDMVKELVLKEDPIPTHNELIVADPDPQMMDLVGSKVTQVKAMDQALGRVQKKVLNIMGPLGGLWKYIHKLKKKGEGEIDVDYVIDSLEKTVMLVGQANVGALFQRRLNVLSHIMGNNKQAHSTGRQIVKRVFVVWNHFQKVFV